MSGMSFVKHYRLIFYLRPVKNMRSTDENCQSEILGGFPGLRCSALDAGPREMWLLLHPIFVVYR